mgnify:CR=1 FL=1
MKLDGLRGLVLNVNVAPFVGAWIETPTHIPVAVLDIVAPFVGAWIETDIVRRIKKTGESRSLRGSVD